MTEPVLHLGDCLDVLRELEPDSIEACVTDPPYGFGDGKTAGFMGKEWDRDVPGADLWREVYRVLKPGAHLLSFFGTRTYHRGVCAIEDAGFEIRDQVQWIYGSGFPKSLDVSKAIDSAAGAEREVVGQYKAPEAAARPNTVSSSSMFHGEQQADAAITAPATDAAKQWDGWGTALKPAAEPIVVARKPLSGTVASNVLEHGCGGLNIDGCRVPGAFESGWSKSGSKASDNIAMSGANYEREAKPDNANGRWPANVIHDGSDEVLAEFAKYGERKSAPPGVRNRDGTARVYGGVTLDKSKAPDDHGATTKHTGTMEYGDTGTAARFFKACEETDEEWIQQHLGLIASTAGSCFSLQSRHVDSALNRAVTGALPVGTVSIGLKAHSMSATAQELRRLCESVTTAIPSIAQRSLLGLPLEKLSGMHSRVSVATNQTQIGTMMITIDHWKSDGSAAPVTFSITGTSTEHGAADSESRMFYCAKSSAAEREEGLEWLEPQVINTATPPGSPGSNSPRAGAGRTGARRNHHPTVKPIDLMRYLCRLVTPPGGTVLDPFAGSGSTLIAAYREGFASIGIERDKDYFEMATERVKNATAQMRLAL